MAFAAIDFILTINAVFLSLLKNIDLVAFPVIGSMVNEAKGIYRKVRMGILKVLQSRADFLFQNQILYTKETVKENLKWDMKRTWKD